jgi:hypothetical protein
MAADIVFSEKGEGEAADDATVTDASVDNVAVEDAPSLYRKRDGLLPISRIIPDAATCEDASSEDIQITDCVVPSS